MAEQGDAKAKRLKLLHNDIAEHLEKICELFTNRPKITILIRTPWLELEGKDGDVLLTDDVKRHTLERLDSFVAAIVGKHLTYKELTA